MYVIHCVQFSVDPTRARLAYRAVCDSLSEVLSLHVSLHKTNTNRRSCRTVRFIELLATEVNVERYS
jgi:hypothetical protein